MSREAFVVETATGARVTPDCATLALALEPLELRTVLLTGTFGTADAQPRAVEVSVAAGLFHDPGDDANPATNALVLDRTP